MVCPRLRFFLFLLSAETSLMAALIFLPWLSLLLLAGFVSGRLGEHLDHTLTVTFSFTFAGTGGSQPFDGESRR